MGSFRIRKTYTMPNGNRGVRYLNIGEYIFLGILKGIFNLITLPFKLVYHSIKYQVNNHKNFKNLDIQRKALYITATTLNATLLVMTLNTLYIMFI